MKDRAARSLLLLGGLAIALLIFEVGLRAAGIAYPPFVRFDADRGWALRPGQEGWVREEGAAFVRINRSGLRDREHAPEKPAGTVRIAVLGDSYAEALQVPLEETFWAVMARELEGCPALAGRTVEAVNFGVSGYGTAQELLTLRHHVWPYSPDVVLLAFLPSNDVSDNSRALVQESARPYFVYRGGELVLDTSFQDSASGRWRRSALFGAYQWALERSRVLQLVYAARLRLGERRTLARLQGSGTDGQEGGLANAVYRAPRHPAWQEAWRVTEGLLALMNGEVRAQGAGFLVATLTRGIQVHPDRTARARFMRSAAIDDFLLPESRLTALGRRDGFAVLPLAPAFQAEAEKRGIFLHGFGPHQGTGHWNAAGHRLAGQLLADTLCACATADGRLTVHDSCGALNPQPRSGSPSGISSRSRP